MTRSAPDFALPTPRQMNVIDQAAVDGGIGFDALMERAGRAVAEVVARHTPAGAPILVLAGPGNNGGDAFVAARILSEWGQFVSLIDLSGGAGELVAGAARAAYHGTVAEVAGDALERAEVIVDGLFGGGLARDVAGTFAEVVRRVNARPRVVVAIDVPSGVDGATGEVRGTAVEARHTVTFQRRRPGHLLLPGRDLCGEVIVADIGIPDAAVAAAACRTFVNVPALWRDARPVLALAGHKYDRGHAVVVSGPMTATGAARMAAASALRTGAGLVTMASPGDALLVNAHHLTAVMLERADGAEGLAASLADKRRNAVCLGPGLPAGEATREMVRAALAAPARAVLDAGALTAFAGDPDALCALTKGPGAVLTPHAGEFARLFGAPEGGKLAAARRAAEASGAVVVLKGPDTVIAAPDGRAAIGENAPPWLATAGAGDVLAGMITAFLALGVAYFEAAAMGVWLHGDVAQRVGPGLIATDLIANLRHARAAFDHV
ncbi:bifunctional ADP-dependent NAD(P)H-hydrate dehydratase/NAD(P)H-hydrate epimerase [Acuticoccus yangtzensis]|uniref:bifunctional ADP-dependent NAD(P)H-hydrate dehydratase/NAD(P)H-hydrate epimerase n=1 Tax=Acuticoccus yangtzensis TaxID=1443441 RepID=UPI00094992AC|nr:bifunctional ADP-dependent NAD(P)H-hydrate dehydratase/NAD(P)H-hydrate epimerase [Acuticoccus yangtzensis]